MVRPTINDIYYGTFTAAGEIRVFDVAGNEVRTTHPMDKNHPRKCFACGRELKWEELLRANLPEEANLPKWYILVEGFEKYKELKKLWRDSRIQFYCCRCYKMMQW